MEKKHYILIGVAVVVLIVAIILWPKKPKATDQANQQLGGGDLGGGDLTPAQKEVAGGGGNITDSPTLNPLLLTPLGFQYSLLKSATGIASGGGQAGNTAGNGGTSAIAAGAIKFANNAAVPRMTNFPFKNGSKGDEVKAVQRYVNLKWIELKKGKKAIIKEDGAWGPKSANAWKQLDPWQQVTQAAYINTILPYLKSKGVIY
jgi:hypothetical protein